MSGMIYTVADDGKLTAMAPAAPENEDVMQRLVAQYPEIIADQDGQLLLIRREQPIADSDESGGRWSLDHLFVTRSGVPVLVELKRAVDTRLRREVVGQMLDYAANATAHWKAGTIASSFALTVEGSGQNVDEVLADFLGDGADPQSFWEQVDANFSAGRIKLVFVADRIPRELARIVEFLNEQMKADVRAVELSWFEGNGIKAFAPRVIGETERAKAAKLASGGALPPVSLEEWIARELEPHGLPTVDAARHYIAAVAAAGGHAEVSSAQGSIVAVFDLPIRTIFPFLFNKNGTVSFALKYLKAHAPFSEEPVRQGLYDRLVGAVGPLTTSSLQGFPSFPSVRLNEPPMADRFVTLLAEIAGLART
jgi:hypothetical protein